MKNLDSKERKDIQRFIHWEISASLSQWEITGLQYVSLEEAGLNRKGEKIRGSF